MIAPLVILLAQASVPSPEPASINPARLSRAEAVALALSANPEMKKSRAALDSLEGQKKEALADALPELTGVGTGTRFRDPTLLNSPQFDEFPLDFRDALTPVAANLFDGSLQLRQTLWSFKLGRTLKAARFGLEMGREQVRGTERQVALQTLRAYDDLVLAVEKAVVAGKRVRQMEKHLEMAKNRREAGVATELDVLRSEVNLANARAQMEQISGEADFARGALNAVLVRPIDAPVEPAETLTREPLDLTLDEVLAEALESRAEVKAAELSVRVYEQLVGVEQAESKPRLDFAGGWGYSVRQPSNFLERDFARWNAAVTLTVPVFDGFRTAGRVAQARANLTRAEQDRIALENRVRLEARQAVDRLRTAGRVLDAAELNVTQATRALEMTQANYRHGAATTLDVLDAQAALTLAETLRLQALFDHSSARAAVRYVMGRSPLDDAPAAAAPKAGAE